MSLDPAYIRSVFATQLTGTDTMTSNSSTGASVAVDLSDNVIVVGQYLDTDLSLYDASGTTAVPSGIELSASGTSCYIAKYNKYGAAIWATKITSDGSPTFTCVTTDQSNNIYAVGHSTGTVVDVYDQNNLTPSIVLNLPSYGSLFAFIVKYNSNGIAQWVNYALNTLTTSYNYSVSCDISGNVYVLGNFIGGELTVYDVGGSKTPSPTPTTIIPLVGSNYTTNLIKYNSDGVNQLVASVGGATAATNAYTVKTNTESDIIIMCQIDGDVTIYDSVEGGGTVISSGKSITNIGLFSTLIVKYDSNCVSQWANIISSSGSDFVAGNIATNDLSNNYYVYGLFNTVINVYDLSGSVPGSTVLLTTSGTLANFIVKYDSSGNASWINKQTASGLNPFYLVVDLSNNLYTTSQMNGSVSFFDSSGSSMVSSEISIPSATSNSAFVAKYDSSGVTLYASKIQSSTSSNIVRLKSIAIDSHNSAYLFGYFQGPNMNVFSNDNTTILQSIETPISSNVSCLIKYFDRSFTVDDTLTLQEAMFYAIDGDQIKINGADLSVGTTDTYTFQVYQKSPAVDIVVTLPSTDSITMPASCLDVNYKYLINIMDTSDMTVYDGDNNQFYGVFFLKVMDQSGNFVTDFTSQPLIFKLHSDAAHNGTGPYSTPLSSLNIYRLDTSGSDIVKTLITSAPYNAIDDAYVFTLTSNSTYGGGGEPHIVPIIKPRSGKKHYDLPDIDKSCWRLLEYKDLIVNCSTKKLIIDDFPKYVHTGDGLKQKTNVLHLDQLTYFDQLYVKYKQNELIFNFDTGKHFIHGSNIKINQESTIYKANVSADHIYPATGTCTKTNIRIDFDNEYIEFDIYADIYTDDRSNIRIGNTNIDLLKVRGCLYSETDCKQINDLYQSKNMYYYAYSKYN